MKNETEGVCWSSISGTYVSVFSENCGRKCEQRFNHKLFNTSMIPPTSTQQYGRYRSGGYHMTPWNSQRERKLKKIIRMIIEE